MGGEREMSRTLPKAVLSVRAILRNVPRLKLNVVPLEHPAILIHC
jgi:hypothetical protein